MHLALDHHLQDEFHAAALQSQCFNRVFTESAQTAVEVTATSAGEKESPERAQQRVSKVAMHRRHGAGRNPTAVAVTHHEVISLAKLCDKRRECRKVVTLIRVSHDDVFTFRGGNPGGQSRPVTTDRHRNNTRIQPRRQLDRSIGAPVIRYEHFSADSVLLKKSLRLGDTTSQSPRLVKA